MFKKNFKVKTSTTVKGSDRRKLRNLLEAQYPSLTDDDLNSIIPNRNELTQTKAMTHSGSIAMIYTIDKNPIFFQVDEHCFPTVYTLWKHPNLVPVVTTVPPVLEKIINGADLMAPGVVIDETTIVELHNFKANDACAVRICGNKSSIAVGLAVMSKEELCTEGIKGKAVIIVHCYRDHLWLSGDQSDPPIILEESIQENIEVSEDIATESIEDNSISINEQLLEKLDLNEVDSIENNADEASSNCTVPDFSMDDILLNCFMLSVKTHGKKIELPILNSTFYSSYVLKSCPPGLGLDIKKTTFKKVSTFFKKMQKEGILTLKEFSKGAESITAIRSECNSVKSFVIDPIFNDYLQMQKPDKPIEVSSGSNVQDNYKFPSVTELYVISAQVKALFAFSNFRKGDTVVGSAVRDVIKNYVKENSLQCEENPREVKLDPVLSDCALNKGQYKETMTWEELYRAIISKMTHAFEVAFDGREPTVKKGKLEPISVTTATRTGNKKVTLIQNLETYGINPEKLAQHMQVAVAASTSISPSQNGKGVTVLIQGNQIRYLQKLFLDIYKVPRKYVQGLDAVPKKK